MKNLIKGFTTLLISSFLFCQTAIAHEDLGFTPYTDATYQQLKKDKKPFVLAISATWCHFCVKQEKVLMQLKRLEIFKDLPFIRADYDKDLTIVNEYDVQMIPTLIIHGKNNYIKKQGLQDSSSLVRLIVNNTK